MSRNPIARIRLWGSAALIAVVVLAIGAALMSEAYWPGWPWLIGAVALGYAAVSFAAHLRYPDQADAAWDEQNLAAHWASLRFGYWAALGVFIALLGAVSFGPLDAAAAFYWMGPVLGIAPVCHYLTSVARGRAE